MSLRCSKCGTAVNYFAPYGTIVWWECGCGQSWKKGDEKKPPIGIMPRKFWDEQRIQDLAAAMGRYIAANRPVPSEWVEEYNELTKRLA
ncbi:hypothetical protein HP398_29800 [Brevibacillus sp. HB1.4B]|uniref:hypothetical protein n=1 Tax=Brevibacillus sp. HB1.4B TaxID=2738845 RepID=UPI00156B8851|nr:hypothetical protein [Brevibacillus sp. HB1.4B]NRS20617.1 hypothetical protein [Brevibacillus sp. HB1.4B]